MVVKLSEAESLSKKLRQLTQKQRQLFSKSLQLDIKLIDKASKDIKTAQALYDKLYLVMNVNTFTRTENLDNMTKYLKNIEYAAQLGLKFQKKSNLSNEAQRQLVSVIKENGMKYVTNLGDELKTELVNILSNGLTSGQYPEAISTAMKDAIQTRQSRAETIARTETMRANTATLFANAKSIGATHFVVDNRAEACETCQDEYEGQIFTIDQTDLLPPLHPNCCCVAVFFEDPQEAQGWSNDLESEKQNIRDSLTDQGISIKPDGTSQNTNN